MNAETEFIVVTDKPEEVTEAVSVAVPFEPYCAGYPDARKLSDYKAIRELTKSRSQRLYIMMPDLILESELDGLDQFLSTVSDSDGIYYGDEAIPASLNDYEGALICQPETLVCSSADARTILSMGADYVSLAHELSLDEITSIARNCDHLEVLIHGHYPILYSGRRLISNYGQAIDTPLSDGTYSIIESTRSEAMPVVQNGNRTIVFSAQPHKSSNQIEALKSCGIRRMRIDTRFIPMPEVHQVIEHYLTGVGSVSGSDSWYGQTSVTRKEQS